MTGPCSRGTSGAGSSRRGRGGWRARRGPRGRRGPPGPTFAAFKDDDDPVADPDRFTTSAAGRVVVTTPAPGRLMAVYSSTGVSALCSPPGGGSFGLYVDDVPVPDTRRNFASGSPTGPDVLLGVTATAVPAGEHVIQLGFDCPAGDFVTATLSANSDLGVILLGG